MISTSLALPTLETLKPVAYLISSLALFSFLLGELLQEISNDAISNMIIDVDDAARDSSGNSAPRGIEADSPVPFPPFRGIGRPKDKTKVCDVDCLVVMIASLEN